MGSHADEHAAMAEPLGRWLANAGVHLLTGGGEGVMRAVSRAFAETPGRRGQVIGVLPLLEGERVGHYPNPFVEIPIRTHLPHSGERGTDPTSRNHINVLTSDIVVALPGGTGTRSEVELCLLYGRPVCVWHDGSSELDLPDGALMLTAFRDVAAWLSARLSERVVPVS